MTCDRFINICISSHFRQTIPLTIKQQTVCIHKVNSERRMRTIYLYPYGRTIEKTTELIQYILKSTRDKHKKDGISSSVLHRNKISITLPFTSFFSVLVDSYIQQRANDRKFETCIV
jgi:hypothetical protein